MRQRCASSKPSCSPNPSSTSAGSYYVEYLTDQLAQKAWGHIQEVLELGGMAKAIETGVPKMRIEEAAARKQARIDSGSCKITSCIPLGF